MPSTASCLAKGHSSALQVLVRDASSSSPLDGAVINTDIWGATTDSTGNACVEDLESTRQRVIAWRLGYAAESTSMVFKAGIVSKAFLALHRLPPPCCRLEGAWSVTLHVQHPGRVGTGRAGATAAGSLVFDSVVPDPMPQLYERPDPVVRYEFGRHAVDLSPILGGPYGRDVSTTVFGDGPSIVKEIVGIIETGDSVSMTIIPRMSHGGLTLHGRILGDSITGSWWQNAYCCGATGAFVMHRSPWTSGADSLVAVAIGEADEERVAAQEAGEAFEKRAGRLRLRTYDVAAGHYIEANYWVSRLGTDPAHEVSTMLSSADTGWSQFDEEEPGTYGIALSDYLCGEKTFFAKDGYARRTVVLRTHSDVDVDFNIDTRTVPAVSSYDNPGARRCSH
jgi:hypothetical protein